MLLFVLCSVAFNRVGYTDIFTQNTTHVSPVSLYLSIYLGRDEDLSQLSRGPVSGVHLVRAVREKYICDMVLDS